MEAVFKWAAFFLFMEEIKKYYSGFWLSEEVGNNAFSYAKRDTKKLWVPQIIKGYVEELAVSDKICFSEYEDGAEKNFCGLKHFIFTQYKHTPVVIFDNHNHAFFFWHWALKKGWIKFGDPLVHVDQHTDMRKPAQWLNGSEFSDSRTCFNYTNHRLNVGNFIQPALKLNLFSSVDIIDSSYTLEKCYSKPLVLDVDIDFFSPDMEYIDYNFKINQIKSYMNHARFITMATSPYFIEQKRAIEVIKDLFS